MYCDQKNLKNVKIFFKKYDRWCHLSLSGKFLQWNELGIYSFSLQTENCIH